MIADVFFALLLIGLLLLVGRLLRERIRFFRTIFLPSSIIAGALALLLGPQLGLGPLIAGALGLEDTAGIFPTASLGVWRSLPGIFINVVFAALFLGHVIPHPGEIWRKAGPQVAFGQILAWGQYTFGILLAIFVLAPFFDLPPFLGALIEISFEGGHGTAAGMAATFAEFGFADGADLAMGLATIGVVSGVLLGTILINWGVHTGRIELPDGSESLRELEDSAFESAAESMDVPSGRGEATTDPLSIQLGFVGLAIAIGWLILQGLVALERVTWGGAEGLELMTHIPLFPLAMIGGVLLQLTLNRLGHGKAVDKQLMSRISGASLDFIIVAALATLSLTTLGEYLTPFLLLAFVGIAWNVGAFWFIAPRIIPQYSFQRGIGDFGQSMGVTVTGLLLIRMADPQNKTGALESFGYKQLLTEPFVGGGLFTAASIPLIVAFGAGSILALVTALLGIWLGVGFLLFRRARA
jgi:glutamate:Na+ symporter, ESS family